MNLKKNFYQEKMGFAVPLEGWIKKELRNEIFGTIDSETSFIKDKLNFNIEDLFKELDKGNKSYKNRIWKLYVLENAFKNIKTYKKIYIL